MRTITTTTELYTFEELTQEAKKTAMERMTDIALEDRRNFAQAFEENADMYLGDLYPNSDLKIEYSLSYCQGDGLNIYGKLSLKDCIERCGSGLTEREIELLEKINQEIFTEFSLMPNDRYTYCIVDEQDYFEEYYYEIDCMIEDIIEEEGNENVREEFETAMETIKKLIVSDLEHQAYILEINGYKWFYEIEGDEVLEYIKAMEFEFTAEGMPY